MFTRDAVSAHGVVVLALDNDAIDVDHQLSVLDEFFVDDNDTGVVDDNVDNGTEFNVYNADGDIDDAGDIDIHIGAGIDIDDGA